MTCDQTHVCFMCNELPVAWINGTEFCNDHMEEGLKVIARGILVAHSEEHGCEPDLSDERMEELDVFLNNMINELKGPT